MVTAVFLNCVMLILYMHLQLAVAEARHAGLQGALVVVLRSMMGQERGTREELGHLAAELDASLSAQIDSSCHCSCNFLAEAGILGGDGLRTGPPKPCRWAEFPIDS